MRSERAACLFDQIAHACRLIRAWTDAAGSAEAAFAADSLTRSAIERQFLVISEAAIRLNRLDPALCPTLAPSIDWAGVRGTGNVIRHRYDALDITFLIGAVADRLPALQSAAEGAAAQLRR